MTVTLSTRNQILDCAQGLIQTRGYNGFSFRDIAGDIGIKSASIHYYYPGKTDLAVAVASKYRADFMEATQSIAASSKPAHEILSAYASLFEVTLKSENKLCLCGMLASEVNSVDPELRVEISGFFKEQHELLTGVLSKGQSTGEIDENLDPESFAKTFLATLEGAMMMARINNAPSDIMQAANEIISLIGS